MLNEEQQTSIIKQLKMIAFGVWIGAMIIGLFFYGGWTACNSGQGKLFTDFTLNKGYAFACVYIPESQQTYINDYPQVLACNNPVLNTTSNAYYCNIDDLTVVD